MRSIALLLGALFLCAPTLADAFDPSELKPIAQPLPDAPEVDRTIFGSVDFEKLRNLSPADPIYKLSQKVAFLRMGGSCCSGFLVGPDLLLTNGHCVDRNINTAQLDSHIDTSSGVQVYMEYYQDRHVGPMSARATQVIDFSPSPIHNTNAKGVWVDNGGLDYALLRLDNAVGKRYGWVDFSPLPPEIGASAMGIAHSKCRSKELVRRNSRIVRMRDNYYVQYMMDSQGGSSGSPAFYLNEDRVFALHHAESGRANQGIAIGAVYPRIAQWLPGHHNWQELHRLARARTDYNQPLSQNARKYREGEPLVLDLGSRPGYHTVLAADQDGNVNLLWPNGLHRDTRLDRLMKWPNPQLPFTIDASGPAGLQMVLTLVTAEPLAITDQWLAGDEVFASLDGNDLSRLKQQLAGKRYSASINYADVGGQ